MNQFVRAAALLSLLVSVPVAAGDVTVKDPWVRATVPTQKSTGAYMQITSADDARLVEVRTPVAGLVEIHEMKMDKGIMRMRVLPDGLNLPAGKALALKSSGYHVMLMDLKQTVKEGDVVPLTLVIEGREKRRATVEVNAWVKPLAGGGHRGGMDHSKH